MYAVSWKFWELRQIRREAAVEEFLSSACRYRDQRDRPDLTNPDTLSLHLETRFEQLRVGSLALCAQSFHGKHGHSLNEDACAFVTTAKACFSHSFCKQSLQIISRAASASTDSATRKIARFWRYTG